MGEVKRYDVAEATTDEWGYHVPSRMEEYPNGEYVEHSDYARLERERDEAVSVADSMGRDAVEFSAKLAEAQAELTRLRAVEAAAKVEWTPTAADIPEQLMAAKRIHVGRCDAFDDWFVGWGKSEDCHAEGTANHWFWLAYLLLGLVKESDRPYNEDKPLPFSPRHIRDRLGIAEACGRKG